MPEGADQNINWETPSGRLIRKFIATLPKDRPIVLNVFGSTPLQLKVDATFLSGDVAIFSDQDFAEHAQAVGLAKGQSEPYIEIVPPNVFIATDVWRERGDKVVFGNVTVYIASPLDVLVGKVRRLEQKDLDAFDLMKLKTGGPSEDELKKALQAVVFQLFRPTFDEENPGGDPKANTRRLWLHLFGHDIDVSREIIAPGIALTAAGRGYDLPDSRNALREIKKP